MVGFRGWLLSAVGVMLPTNGGTTLRECPAYLAVTQIESPSQEEVDEVHQRFKAALKELFDSHKHLMPGWDVKELLIV